MSKDINIIIANSDAIRVETVAGANTAERVGSNLKDLGEVIKEDQESLPTGDEKAALDSSVKPLTALNPVVDEETFTEANQLLAGALTTHATNTEMHLTEDEHSALEHAPIPLTAANPAIDATTFDNHATDWNLHLGSDQNAAFDNANAPKGTNPLATMADLPTPPPPPDPMTFDFMKVANVLDIGDAYEDVIELITPLRSAGVYVYNIAVTYTYNRTNSSVFVRVSNDGGATWVELIEEPKDKTDKNPLFYAYPKQIAADEVLKLKVQMKKEAGGATLDVNFADVWIDQKM